MREDDQTLHCEGITGVMPQPELGHKQGPLRFEACLKPTLLSLVRKRSLVPWG